MKPKNEEGAEKAKTAKTENFCSFFAFIFRFSFNPPISMHAKTFYGTAFTNASVVLLARVVGDYSEVLKRKDVLSASYSASLVDPVFPDRSMPVEGHQNVPLDLDSVFFDSLQTDSSWDADALGYNFRLVPDVSQNPLFTEPRRLYCIDCTIQLSEAGRMPARIKFVIFTH